MIRDREAEAHGYLRIVDESGEDYGYAADRFFAIELPKPWRRFFSRRRLDNWSPNHALEPTASPVQPGRWVTDQTGNMGNTW